MFGLMLVIAAIGFVIWAVATEYKNTDPNQPVSNRVEDAIKAGWKRLFVAGMAAGAALLAQVMPWIESVFK